MLRCKVGDLAMMLRGAYIGQFVTVKKYIGVGKVLMTTGETAMGVDLWETTEPDNPVVYSRPTNGRYAFEDSDLLPIRPDELKEEEEREVTA